MVSIFLLRSRLLAYLFLFYVYGYVACICVYALYVGSAQTGQKRVFDSLELEL